MKIESYTITEKVEVNDGLFDETTETRYRIVDDDGKIMDDAQGYGYKSSTAASKALWYKFKGGRAKMAMDERMRKEIYRKHPGFHSDCDRYFMQYGIKDSRADQLESIKEIMKHHGIDVKLSHLFV